MDDLAGAAEDELEAVPEIGPRTAESIVKFFQENENRKVIEKLKAAGVNMASAVEIDTEADERFAGKTFVLTGALQSMSRQQGEEEIKKRGGKSSGSVSKNTDYVIVGENPGSKYNKAKELNVATLTEEEFLTMLR